MEGLVEARLEGCSAVPYRKNRETAAPVARSVCDGADNQQEVSEDSTTISISTTSSHILTQQARRAGFKREFQRNSPGYADRRNPLSVKNDLATAADSCLPQEIYPGGMCSYSSQRESPPVPPESPYPIQDQPLAASGTGSRSSGSSLFRHTEKGPASDKSTLESGSELHRIGHPLSADFGYETVCRDHSGVPVDSLHDESAKDRVVRSCFSFTKSKTDADNTNTAVPSSLPTPVRTTQRPSRASGLPVYYPQPLGGLEGMFIKDEVTKVTSWTGIEDFGVAAAKRGLATHDHIPNFLHNDCDDGDGPVGGQVIALVSTCNYLHYWVIKLDQGGIIWGWGEVTGWRNLGRSPKSAGEEVGDEEYDSEWLKHTHCRELIGDRHEIICLNEEDVEWV